VKYILLLCAVAGALICAPVKVGTGAYPDLAVDAKGRVHIVYARDEGVYYRAYQSGKWTSEEKVPIEAGMASRSDPDVAVDTHGKVHVLAGKSYAVKESGNWRTIPIDIVRDTAMAIDSRGNVYVCRRGGHNGGLVGLLRRRAEESRFEPLPDPDIANGLPKGQGSDHVYGHVVVNAQDDSIHVVARHGAPKPIIYRVSTDGGKNWAGSAVADDKSEAPSAAVAPDGSVYVVTGRGEVYQRSGSAPFTWTALGKALSAAQRDLPALSVGSNGSLFAVSFGGRVNVRTGGKWMGEKTLPAPAGKRLGFVEVATAGSNAFVVYEEGDHVQNDEPAGSSTIWLARLMPDGGISAP
jgi:hypothetical protein